MEMGVFRGKTQMGQLKKGRENKGKRDRNEGEKRNNWHKFDLFSKCGA